MRSGPPRRDARLPRTARDLFRLRPHERLLYDGLTAFFERTGLWQYPIRAEGDLERMSWLDKAYWFYKAQNPIRRARRGWGLEAFFAAQREHACRLPSELRVERELRIAAVGDLWTHAFLARSRDRLYAGIADLVFGADVAMANLECTILQGAGAKLEFDMKAGPPLAYDEESFELVSGHAGRRFDFVTAANNHSLDFGAARVDSTIRILRERGIAFLGINARDADAREPAIIRRGGIALGVVGFTFGLNARKPPPERPLIVNRMSLNAPPEAIDYELLDTQLSACATAEVDFVVAQLHWGMEHELYPTPEQVEVAHALAERGVDAIIGHHPHVAQPFELYRTRRDPARIVPIYYSLGNLVNPCSVRYMCESAVARIELAKGALADGTARTYVKHADAERVVQVADPVRGTIAIERVSPAGS